MILIVGDTHDDVLYFETVLANKESENLFDRFKVLKGTISSQEVMVIRDMAVSVLTSSVLTHIFANNIIDLVIGVGKCVAVSESLKPGNIAVSSNVIAADVDLSIFRNVGMAEIPGFSREFPVQEDIFGYLTENLNKRPNIDFHRSTFLSSDNMSKDMVDFLREHKTMFASKDDKYVVDHNSAGIALSCTLAGIPFIVAKVIEQGFDQVKNLRTYTNVLSRYIDLGKGVTETISNIGRSDILYAEGGHYGG